MTDATQARLDIARHSMDVDAAKNERADRYEDALFEIQNLKRMRRKDKSFGLLSAAKDALINKGVLFKVPSKRRQQARCVEGLMWSAVDADTALTRTLLDHEALFLIRNGGLSREAIVESYDRARKINADSKDWYTRFDKKRPAHMFTARLGKNEL